MSSAFDHAHKFVIARYFFNEAHDFFAKRQHFRFGGFGILFWTEQGDMDFVDRLILASQLNELWCFLYTVKQDIERGTFLDLKCEFSSVVVGDNGIRQDF